MLMLGGTVGGTGGFMLSGYMAVVSGAFVGATAVLCIIIFFSTLVRSNVMLLIIGIMVGYLASSMISLLNFFATSDGVYSYMLWGMGDFFGRFVAADAAVRAADRGGTVRRATADEATERITARRTLCRESRGTRTARADLAVDLYGGVLTAVSTAFLRADCLYRVVRTRIWRG